MNQEDLEILKKYLNGNTTSEEERFIHRWLIKNEGNKEVWDLLREEWRQTSAENELDLDMDEAWNEFKRKVNNPAEWSKAPGIANRLEHSFRRRPSVIMGASIVTVLISVVFLFLIFRSTDTGNAVPEQPVAYDIQKTTRGQKLSISLPDGSFVKLNSSTELRIPQNYNVGKERVVYLSGEAFFEVAKDENRPFKVISGKITSQVLGTSFNVNTFLDQDDVSVAVITGEVRVSNASYEIVLHPDEMTTVGPATTVPEKKTFNTEYITGWRNNLLIFDKVSLEEIIESLEQWYGVEFVIKGKPQRTGKYSGRFENKPLKWVLEGLGFSSAFGYKIIDRTVYLKFK